MKKASLPVLLRTLARLFGIHTSYIDVGKNRQRASVESLQRILSVLGVAVNSAEEAEEALRERQLGLQQRVCDPMILAWNGNCREFELRFPRGGADSRRIELQLESGETLDLSHAFGQRMTPGSVPVEHVDCDVRVLQLPQKLPLGYHMLYVESNGTRASSTVVSAPRQAFCGMKRTSSRDWGVVSPVYSLRSDRNWGAGDLADLAALWRWLEPRGGRVVGTLPLMATHLQEPLDPSPYAPLSRRAWNEFYLAIDQLPELADSPAAAELVSSAGFQQELRELRGEDLIDYRRQHLLRRKVLELLAADFFRRRGPRWVAMQEVIRHEPFLEDYARFRATWEKMGKPWTVWPERQRGGKIEADDYDQSAYEYHLFAQWATREQVAQLAAELRHEQAILYLDYPVGVHPHGYDAWRHADLFVPNVSVGAPPDAVFTKGQNWGLAPLSPEHLRSTGYRYFIESVRCQMQQAGALRIDHVMGLHRQFWVPADMPASKGVFVSYPADEFYAVLCLESHRQRTQLMGENLGTVTPAVNRALKRHGISGTYVAQYELNPQADEPLSAPPSLSVASINTHDMPTFAAYLQGLDLDDLFQLGLFDERGIVAERERRTAIVSALAEYLQKSGLLSFPAGKPSANTLRDALLLYLAGSESRNLLIGIEDLWLEQLPQNVPGTSSDRPNWRRKHRLSFTDICQRSDIDALLQQIQQARIRHTTANTETAKSAQQPE